MDRQHRHDLKHDRFVDEIGALSVKARENQRLIFTIVLAILAVALVASGIYLFRNTQEKKAQAALATAIETIESPLLPAAPAPGQQVPPNAKFKTEAERATAAEKLFKDVQANHPGSDASDIAGFYIGRMAAARGDVPTARKNLEEFIDDHGSHFLAGGARYSLYQLRIDNGEANQVVTELNAELAKAEPALPGDAILNLLAHAYELQGNGAKARETYRRITTEYPDSPYTLEAQRRVGA
jgi:TolA-binding protein